MGALATPALGLAPPCAGLWALVVADELALPLLAVWALTSCRHVVADSRPLARLSEPAFS